MNKTATILMTLSLGLFAFNSYAANPNPKPKCPQGQIPVLDGTQWQCKQPDITSGEAPQQGLLLPAVQSVREAAPTGGNQAPPAGSKPSCPMGQIAKLEMGHWQCKPMELTAPQKEQRAAFMKLGDIKGESNSAAPAAGPRPQCPKGQLPKMENGHWKCAQPGFAAPAKPE